MFIRKLNFQQLFGYGPVAPSLHLKKSSSFNPPLHPQLSNLENRIEREIRKHLSQESVECNLTDEENTVLYGLAHNHSIRVMQPDKGGGIVIMSQLLYDSKMGEILYDTNKYTVTSIQEIHLSYKKIDLTIKDMLDQEVIEFDTFSFLENNYPKVPTIFGVPKIHKCVYDPPLRPIVAAQGSKTHSIAKFLDWKLKQVWGKESYLIKDSWEFLRRVTTDLYKPNLIFLTIDVVDLFSVIPTEVGLKWIEEALWECAGITHNDVTMVMGLLELDITDLDGFKNITFKTVYRRGLNLKRILEKGAIPKTLKIWVPDQINAGTNISLNCSVANIFPKNSVQMLFSTDVLKGSEISFSGENENGTFTLTTTLLFTPQPLHHQKVFTCKVIHTDLNKTLHTNITIDVKYPPKIKSLYSCLPSTEEYCRICESEANPAANITWNIINGDKEETLKGDDLQINGVRSNGTIRLKSVHGTVYCVATNIYGSDKWSIDNGSKQDSHIVGVIVPAATIAVLLFVSLLVYVICKVHMSKRKTCQPHVQTAHISQRMEEQATDITYMQVRKMVQNNCDQQENSVQDVMYAVVSVTNGYRKKDLHAPSECNTLPIYANVEFPKTNEEKPKVSLAPEMTEYASVLFTK
ncbi:uncharacterized protein LOC122800485 [Protopterus annectens]|uniref:uncharacterized protein LOC122800485 n=1 Tax=Protopterus annectens TaxID=7888 RepID=UPI001CF9D1D0|nr:uncharacterized protein LOC122800485 [Protopterus annectens]